MHGGIKVLGVPLAALLLVAALPAAFAQSFSVTTNKDVYGAGERVIVAGTVKQIDAASTVLVQITKDDASCGQQAVAVERDGSFISRPIAIECGPGDYTVSAYHADQKATSAFRVGEQAQDSEDLRQLRDTLADARGKVNERIRELVNASIPIPEQAVEKYRAGSVQASLAVQSAEHGDMEQANVHLEAALAHFDETLALLSPENMAPLSMAAQKDDGQRRADAADWLGRLGDIYHRLANLAEKNSVNDMVFPQIQLLLTDARNALGAEDLDVAEEALARIEPLMEQARGKLLQSAEDAAEKQSLQAAADRIEKRAERQLEEAEEGSGAAVLVESALSLIGQAKSAIDDDNYSKARELLTSASKALIEANRMS